MSFHNLAFALEDATRVTLLIVCPKCGEEHDADPNDVCPSIAEIGHRVNINALVSGVGPDSPLADKPEDEVIESEFSSIVEEPFENDGSAEISVEGLDEDATEEDKKPPVEETSSSALPGGIPHPEEDADKQDESVGTETEPSESPEEEPASDESTEEPITDDDTSVEESDSEAAPEGEPIEPKEPTPVVLDEPVQNTIPELWVEDDQHDQVSQELDDALTSIDDVDTIGLVVESLQHYIHAGDRAKAEISAAKVYEMMGTIHERHGIANKPVMSVQLEGLSDQTWLEYMQEETSASMEVIIRVLINILTRVAIAILVWLAFNFNQARLQRKAAAEALKNISTQDPEEVARLAREANLKYTPVFDWDRHSYYAPKDYVQALDHLRASLLPSVSSHLAIVDHTVELDVNYISRTILEWAAEEKGHLVSKEESETATRKYQADVQSNIERAASALSGINGIHLGGLLVASDHKVKQKLLNNVRSIADPSSIDTAQSAGVGKESIIFSPYYFVRPNHNGDQVKTLSIKDAGREYDLEPQELIVLARKELSVKDAILSKLETIKNSNAQSIKALENELTKLDHVLKHRKLAPGRTARLNELKVAVHNSKNCLNVIRNTFMSFGRLFLSGANKEGFHV